MTDEVTICNLALDIIGARSEISSLDEDSQSARTLSLHYAPTRGAVLRAAHWNFARKQVALTVLKAAAGAPENPLGAGALPPAPWIYAYAMPSDSVLARYVMPQLESQPPSVPGASVPFFTGPPVRFVISSDADTNGNPITVLLTNQPQAILVYTARIEDSELYDDQFVIAFSNYLGARICNRVNGDKQLAINAMSLATQTIREARATNGNEGLTVNDSTPDWMRARGYASDWAFPPGSMFWMSPQNLTLVS